jgi:hypothetical protein
LTVNQFSFALGPGAAATGFGMYVTSLSKKGRTPYGPGPKGVPILGNAADLPKTDDYKVYTQWAKKYGEHRSMDYFIHSILSISDSIWSPGDFIYLTVLGQPIHLISSTKTASKLMDERAMIYSDRPIWSWLRSCLCPFWSSHYAHCLKNFPSVGWGRTPVLTSSQDSRYAKSVSASLPHCRRSSHTMLKLILDKPDDWLKHIR